jgi:thioredoxin reductase
VNQLLAPLQDVDVVVIGGSVAGLQAALTLGRACRRVTVIDDGHPWNAPAAHVRNFLGQPGLERLRCSALPAQRSATSAWSMWPAVT